MADSRETPRRPPGSLSFFKDVRCEDAGILQLPDETAASRPGPRTSSSPAAANVHARIRATTGELVEATLALGQGRGLQGLRGGP